MDDIQVRFDFEGSDIYPSRFMPLNCE